MRENPCENLIEALVETVGLKIPPGFGLVSDLSTGANERLAYHWLEVMLTL